MKKQRTRSKFRISSVALLVFVLAAVGCTRPIDPTSGEILSGLSKRTNTYFQFLIKNYDTNECRYSSATSKKYWRETNGDLRVIDARMTVVDGLREIRPEYVLLKQALEQVEETQKLFDEGSTKCLDPEALAVPWVDIQHAIDDLSAVANFN